MPATAFVVDDHAGFRVAARALLESVGYHVVGDCADGAAALRALRGAPVDLVLVDLYLPGEDGVDVSDQLVEMGCAATVVIVSSREDASSDPRVSASRATGFIAKRNLSAMSLRRLVP